MNFSSIFTAAALPGAIVANRPNDRNGHGMARQGNPAGMPGNVPYLDTAGGHRGRGNHQQNPDFITVPDSQSRKPAAGQQPRFPTTRDNAVAATSAVLGAGALYGGQHVAAAVKRHLNYYRVGRGQNGASARAQQGFQISQGTLRPVPPAHQKSPAVAPSGNRSGPGISASMSPSNPMMTRRGATLNISINVNPQISGTNANGEYPPGGSSQRRASDSVIRGREPARVSDSSDNDSERAAMDREGSRSRQTSRASSPVRGG